MTIPATKLNSELAGITRRNNSEAVAEAARKAADYLDATKISRLGITTGEVVEGFESLTTDVDVSSDEAPGTGVSVLVDNPTGESIATTPSGFGDLESITGVTVSGSTPVVLSANTPEAVTAAVAEVTGKPVDALTTVTAGVSPTRTSSTAITAVREALTGSIPTSFTSVASSFTSGITRAVSSGFGELLKDINENLSRSVRTQIENLADVKDLDNNTITSIISDLNAGRYLDAAKKLSPFSSFTVEELESRLSSVPTTVSDSIITTDPANDAASGFGSTPVHFINQESALWREGSYGPSGSSFSSATPAGGVLPGAESTQYGPFDFSFITSMEELETELRNATREITEVIIHYTANFIDQAQIGSEQIHQWHLARGWSGIGYHYVIRRDGTIQRGRPINRIGAHAAGLGHNNFSIGISHVAGYTVTSGTPNGTSYVDKTGESITAAQYKAQDKFLRAFYNVFPGGQVMGHSDVDNNKVDPGFDVQSYIRKFGKQNVYEYNVDRGPLSRAELLEARSLQATS